MKNVMPKEQQIRVQQMTSQELIDFQLRLQIECGMEADEAADYVVQAFED